MLRVGSTGEGVKELQTFLAAQGYDVGPLDGIFGPKTDAAVRAFQGAEGLTVDGIVGPNTQVAIETFGVDGTEDVEDTVEPGAASLTGMMAGGTIHLVRNEGGQDDYYVISYEYPPGSGHSFYYQTTLAQLENAIGPNLGGGTYTIGAEIAEAALAGWTYSGDASGEIFGVTGSFDAYISDIMREVTLLASDPTLAGAALQDPEIMLIMLKTKEGKLSSDESKALLRQTSYYQNVLYPGISNFYGQTDNPEGQYAVYLQNISATAKTLGIVSSGVGDYRDLAATLLDKGVTDVAFANFAPTYQQAQANIGFANALSKWTQKYTGKSINSFNDYFDVLAGNAPADILEIAEVAGLQYMADNAGFDISDTQLQTISESIQISQAQAGQLFSSTAKALLALGERGLRRGNLTSNEILESVAGFSSTGANIENILARMRKLAIEEGISDDPAATIFTDFNREGAPIKKGLQSGISEGA